MIAPFEGTISTMLPKITFIVMVDLSWPMIHGPYKMDLIIFYIIISNIPEANPVEHVCWRIGISTWRKSFSNIAIDLNFLQRTMNRNQLSAAIIRVTLKLFIEQSIKQSWADTRVRILTF